MAQFIDKAMVRTGNTVYSGVKNDIAVATDDILKIPTSRNTTEYVVAGHHMNYFILEEANGNSKRYYEKNGFWHEFQF